jgi:hypothetical protein
MRTISVTMGLLAALGAAGCGADEPLPAYPPPMAPAEETTGGDLDSLLEEEAPADEAPIDEGTEAPAEAAPAEAAPADAAAP